jgi:murein DD-endopeptidase MepM/ murein hydrolase activator NlpD
MAGAGGRFFVGNIGATGTATGPHIHQYVKDLATGQYINPETIKSALTGVQIGEGRVPLVSQLPGGGLGWNPATGLTITSRFGRRNAPTAGASTDHQGLDFAGAKGTPIYMQGYGTAAPVANAGGFGNLMTFKTADNKYEIGFGHLDALGKAGKVLPSGGTLAPTVLAAQQRQQDQLAGAGAALSLMGRLFGQARESKDSSQSLYSSLIGNALRQQQQDPASDFLMSYIMQPSSYAV